MNYRWIDYPTDITPELRDRYEIVADILEAAAIPDEPIAICWAHPHEDWTDDKGVNPPRNCLVITKHVEGDSPDEMTFGDNLLSVIMH